MGVWGPTVKASYGGSNCNLFGASGRSRAFAAARATQRPVSRPLAAAAEVHRRDDARGLPADRSAADGPELWPADAGDDAVGWLGVALAARPAPAAISRHPRQHLGWIGQPLANARPPAGVR